MHVGGWGASPGFILNEQFVEYEGFTLNNFTPSGFSPE